MGHGSGGAGKASNNTFSAFDKNQEKNNIILVMLYLEGYVLSFEE